MICGWILTGVYSDQLLSTALELCLSACCHADSHNDHDLTVWNWETEVLTYMHYSPKSPSWHCTYHPEHNPLSVELHACTGFSVTTAHHILPSLSSFYSDMSAYDTGVVLITWSASFFYTSTHCKVKTTSPLQLLLVLLVSVQGSNCIVRLCLGRHKLMSTHRSWYPW
jgi:hypothetical protein